MKSQETIIVHPSNDEQITIIKAFLEALKIKFEFNQEKVYDPKFVEKILQGKKDIEEGKGVSNSIEELNELCK